MGNNLIHGRAKTQIRCKCTNSPDYFYKIGFVFVPNSETRMQHNTTFTTTFSLTVFTKRLLHRLQLLSSEHLGTSAAKEITAGKRIAEITRPAFQDEHVVQTRRNLVSRCRCLSTLAEARLMSQGFVYLEA